MTDFIALIIKGGFVMIPLLVCSIVSVALSIERFLFWKKIKAKEVVHEILRCVELQEFNQALDLGRSSHLPIARVLSEGIAHRDPSPAKAMEAAAQAEASILKTRLGILDTIVTLAPLLGLLGTVVGMIGSFDIMSEAGMGQPHAVTGGVAEALIATATGLLIAILTLLSYNYFTNKTEREIEQMEYFGSRLELLLHSNKETH
jgi:biopolymer transport protein ExbB